MTEHMKKHLFYLLAALFSVTSCAEQYNIAGNSSVNSFDGRMLYLQVASGGNMSRIDSCEVVHGQFNFIGMLDSIVMAEICMDNESLMPLVIENCNLSIRVDNLGQHVSGGPLNERLYSFLRQKERLDNEYMELSYKEMRMMMEGVPPSVIAANLRPQAESLSHQIEELETQFIINNYDNVLGPGIFMIICNQYRYPIMTDQIRTIMKNAPKRFKNHPFVKHYVATAQENMKHLNGGMP